MEGGLILFGDSWSLTLVIVAAAIVSDVWRVLGALVATRIDEGSLVFRYVKAVATTLIAAVIVRLALYPTGDLAQTPALLRLGSLAAAFAAYWLARRSVAVGLIVCEVVLVVGAIAFGPGE